MKLLIVLLCLTTAAFAANHNVVLTVGWTLSTGGTADHLNFKRGTTTGGPYTTIGTVAIPATNPPATFTFTDTSAPGNVLVEGTTYFYVVTAADTPAVTESANSNEVPARIPFTNPAPPSGLNVTVH